MLNEENYDFNKFKDEGYKLDFSVSYSNVETAYSHEFSVRLSKINDESCDYDNVVEIDDGVIIPCELSFDEYGSQWEFCDAISGDLLVSYEAIGTNNNGIKPEVIKELGLDDSLNYESSIMYFSDIQYKDLKDLDILLKYFYLVKESLPSVDTKIALVLLNWEKESEIIKTFTNNNWIIKKADDNNVVAYKKIGD